MKNGFLFSFLIIYTSNLFCQGVFDFNRDEYLKNKKDTFYLSPITDKKIVEIKLNGIIVQVPFFELRNSFDTIMLSSKLIATNRIKDFEYGMAYLDEKIKEGNLVKLSKRFYLRVGMVPLEECIIKCIEKGQAVVFTEWSKPQNIIVRLKTHTDGNDRCKECCWYGREYFIPGFKEYFVATTDLIC